MARIVFGELVPCWRCHGTGKAWRAKASKSGDQVAQLCPLCKGAGYLPRKVADQPTQPLRDDDDGW